MENEKLGTGGNVSELDPRTIKHLDFAGVPFVTGGVEYLPTDIEHQHSVGICTAISRVQLRQKQTGKKYSPDFQYLLQKKYYDLNWTEGSSVLSANKVAKNIGFLPASLWSHTTESDRYLPYPQYIAKLQQIPDSEVIRLQGLCVDRIAGYAQVDVTDAQAIAKAVINSPGQTGILCRYGCQKNWWLPSWMAKDIDPLRNAPETSGHAIILGSFDYAVEFIQKVANTWGKTWCLNGSAHINWVNYPMTEAWVDLIEAPIIPVYIFTKLLRYGMRGFDVKMLQQKLKVPVDSTFGNITLAAVKKFQTANGLTPDGVVGSATNAKLNL